MRKLIVQQLDYDVTPVAGLALVGHYLNALRPNFKRLDATLPIKGGVANSDALAQDLFEFVPPMIETLLASHRPDYGVLPCGWLPLDVDTFAMDNGGTVKVGVGRTYAGVDGLCPLAAYLGAQGFRLELALRPGVQHSAAETDFNLERVIPMAQRLDADAATLWEHPRAGKRSTIWE